MILRSVSVRFLYILLKVVLQDTNSYCGNICGSTNFKNWHACNLDDISTFWDKNLFMFMQLNDFVYLFKGAQTHYKLRTSAAKIFPLNLYYFTRVLYWSLPELPRQAKINIFLRSYSVLLAKTSKQNPNMFT